MIFHKIPFPSNPNWNLCIVSEDDFGEATFADIIAVLESVKSAFEAIMGWEYVNRKPLQIKRGFSPTTYRNRGIITLAVKDRHWAQLIFQFSHELCHYMIDAEVPARLRWFEESICETASLFFLDALAVRWATAPPYPNWTDYSKSIRMYYSNRISTADKLNNESLSEFIYNHLDKLEDDCYNRPINLAVALNLLQVFKQAPNLWTEIPILCSILPEQNLASMLSVWECSASNHNRSAIRSVRQMFGLSAHDLR